MAFPFHKELRIGAYLLKQKLAGPQALSAGADAGAAVPLQSGLRRLRQDRLSRRRSSTAACRSQECLDAVDECGAPIVSIPGGEPLIHKEIGADRRGHRGAQEIRLPVHQRAAAREEARPVQAVALPRSSRSISTACKEHHDKSVCQTGRVRPGRRRHQAPPGHAASASTSTPRSFDGSSRPRTSPRSSTS